MIREERRHKRRFLKKEVTWTLESQALSGKGTLLDLSLSGACLRIYRTFNPESGLIFTLESTEVPLLPKRARLRWYRRMAGKAPVFQCGLVFEPEEAATAPAWDEQAVLTATRIPLMR